MLYHFFKTEYRQRQPKYFGEPFGDNDRTAMRV